jgi:hypothetical protein
MKGRLMLKTPLVSWARKIESNHEITYNRENLVVSVDVDHNKGDNMLNVKLNKISLSSIDMSAVLSHQDRLLARLGLEYKNTDSTMLGSAHVTYGEQTWKMGSELSGFPGYGPAGRKFSVNAEAGDLAQAALTLSQGIGYFAASGKIGVMDKVVSGEVEGSYQSNQESNLIVKIGTPWNSIDGSVSYRGEVSDNNDPTHNFTGHASYEHHNRHDKYPSIPDGKIKYELQGTLVESSEGYKAALKGSSLGGGYFKIGSDDSVRGFDLTSDIALRSATLAFHTYLGSEVAVKPVNLRAGYSQQEKTAYASASSDTDLFLPTSLELNKSKLALYKGEDVFLTLETTLGKDDLKATSSVKELNFEIVLSEVRNDRLIRRITVTDYLKRKHELTHELTLKKMLVDSLVMDLIFSSDVCGETELSITRDHKGKGTVTYGGHLKTPMGNAAIQ